MAGVLVAGATGRAERHAAVLRHQGAQEGRRVGRRRYRQLHGRKAGDAARNKPSVYHSSSQHFPVTCAYL